MRDSCLWELHLMEIVLSQEPRNISCRSRLVPMSPSLGSFYPCHGTLWFYPTLWSPDFHQNIWGWFSCQKNSIAAAKKVTQIKKICRANFYFDSQQTVKILRSIELQQKYFLKKLIIRKRLNIWTVCMTCSEKNLRFKNRKNYLNQIES